MSNPITKIVLTIELEDANVFSVEAFRKNDEGVEVPTQAHIVSIDETEHTGVQIKGTTPEVAFEITAETVETDGETSFAFEGEITPQVTIEDETPVVPPIPTLPELPEPPAPPAPPNLEELLSGGGTAGGIDTDGDGVEDTVEAVYYDYTSGSPVPVDLSNPPATITGSDGDIKYWSEGYNEYVPL